MPRTKVPVSNQIEKLALSLADRVRIEQLKKGSPDNNDIFKQPKDKSSETIIPFKIPADRKISNDVAEAHRLYNERNEETKELFSMRPVNGIKFSKSAASIMDNASMSSHTPSSSGTGCRMKFTDFQVIQVLGEGSYGKVY